MANENNNGQNKKNLYEIESFTVSAEEMQKIQNRIAKALGPLNTMNASVAVFCMENMINAIKSTQQYVPSFTESLKSCFSCEVTQFTGSREECQELAKKLFNDNESVRGE